MTNSAKPGDSALELPKGMRVGLWLVQGLLALVFVGTALWKLLTPIPELASKVPWMGEVSPAFLYLTAALDLLCGLGLVLPTLTRIKPSLTVVAALGSAGFMAGATFFHLSRGEASKTPFNLVLVALSLFVAWGRRSGARGPLRQ